MVRRSKRIVLTVAPGVERWLEVDPAHGRMLDAEPDQSAHLVLVRTPLDGRDRDDAEVDLGQPVQRLQLLGNRFLNPEGGGVDGAGSGDTVLDGFLEIPS